MTNKIYGRIYLITNKINGKMYVGQTKTTIKKRFNKHVCDSNNINSNNYQTMSIVKAIHKYGKENFTIIELDVAYSQVELNILEGTYINKYNTLNSKVGYNIAVVDINGNCQHSEKTKQQMKQTRSNPKYKQIAINNGKKSRGRFYANSSSIYIGVDKRQESQWRAIIQVNKTNKTIGTYNTEIEAAQARDIAELEHIGSEAVLNFPELKEQYLNGIIKPQKRIWGSHKKSNSNIRGVSYDNTRKKWTAKIVGFGSKRFLTKEEAENQVLEWRKLNS